jgi:hypothetical protein
VTETLAEMEAVLRVFSAAGFVIPFGSERDDMLRLWDSEFGGVALSVLLRAAQSWCVTENKFPVLSQFDERITLTERAIAQEEREAQAPLHLSPCAECDGTWVDETPCSDTADGGIFDKTAQHDLRPCSICVPIRYECWRKGHFMPNTTGCSDCRGKSRR